MILPWYIGISLIVSWLLCIPVYRILLYLNIVDTPNKRSSHSKPTVRGGGLAITTIALGSFVAFGITYGNLIFLVIAIAGLAMAVVSFWDDLQSLSPGIRFGSHIGAALIVSLILLGKRPGIDASYWDFTHLLLLGISVIYITGYTNAFNFMDGINGLAACQTAVTALGTALIGGLESGQWNEPFIVISGIIGGAALGFLPHNFPRARMFLGDVGSVPLGFLLSVLVVWIAVKCGQNVVVPVVCLHLNFVLDTLVTLFGRISRGEKWWEAHRFHFYQRLVRSGKSHTFATGVEMVLQAIVLCMMIRYLYAGTNERVVLVLSAVIIWSAFFFFCARAFRSIKS